MRDEPQSIGRPAEAGIGALGRKSSRPAAVDRPID